MEEMLSGIALSTSNVYRVSFQGNGYTGEERVADFALLRASELALAHGSKHFLVVKEGGGTVTALSGGKNPWLVNRHRAELVIELVPVDSPEPQGAYAAELLRDQIRQRYGIEP